MVFRRKKSDLDTRVALLEAKYEQLAKEMGRIEEDIVKILREIELLKYGR